MYFKEKRDQKQDFILKSVLKKATFLNSLLFHIRNTLAHAGFKEVENYYKIIDYDDMGLSAFGFIEKNVFLQLLSAFTK